ncbi:IS4/Tn5 family transposase DNA-binding protein [Tautonia plasticadhaerens]|uniref:Transposase Tn5-like N-terminal domain-containing protein n=1 Tax=Tautonia plasticadhaerens TaxID=2527974 RepID=A0A518HF70_9BACT|nr:hypothetical protein ElP_73930 [Tautonia plasticadhaerens]
MERPIPPEPEPTRWASAHFAGADLADVRRVRRVVRIAGAWADRPGRSIPAPFEDRYDIKAAYHLFDHADATPERLQAGHRGLVAEALRQRGTSLLIEDTTVISYPGRRPVPGLGTVGYSGRGQTGFHLHTVLAARWPGQVRPDAHGRRPALEVLGLADQQSDVRAPLPAGTTRRRPPARKPTDPPTERCAKKVKFPRSPTRPERRRLGPDVTSGVGVRRRGGTARATPPGLDIRDFASPRSSGDASPPRPTG